MSKYISKNEFVKAYQFYYGASKKKAVEFYNNKMKNGEVACIEEMVKGYYKQVRMSFYYD